jgi:hypothetical protein
MKLLVWTCSVRGFCMCCHSSVACMCAARQSARVADAAFDAFGVFAEQAYVIFDFPGQAELFSLHDCMRQIIRTLTKDWHYRCVSNHSHSDLKNKPRILHLQ